MHRGDARPCFFSFGIVFVINFRRGASVDDRSLMSLPRSLKKTERSNVKCY